ncbi:hypothetical protein Vadar_004010 [Vaccinium darrowii]|uniref:Uncharacterized protein n=1 Tax=Vaccinium darrowii TaxID=229202 RepID=A0ACB7ZH45_9ERIC|nr:hypothetical protein Vadar_004010 [Vaccinium darrowii]
MKTIVMRPHFALLSNRQWLKKSSSLRAFSSSSSSSDYSSQSRGGLPRFFSELLPSSKGCIVRIQGDEFWHMAKVLRLSTNDRVELFNGKGGLIEGCIQSIDRTGLDVEALEDPRIVLPQITQWHVFAAFGTLKGGRADWLVEKCTELGASSVTPLLTERSPSISENRVDRLERVILAAAKQCQRLHQMTLNPPAKIVGLLPIIAQAKPSFVAVAEATPVFTALNSSTKESSGSIIIGPEGDFSKKEVDMIIEAGATAVGLGTHRLRVETATIALLSTVMLWSDSLQPLDSMPGLVAQACNSSEGFIVVGDWFGPRGRPCGVIVWPARSKFGVGSRAQGEGHGFLAFRAEETASGWFHRAAFTSRSSRWKDNSMPGLVAQACNSSEGYNVVGDWFGPRGRPCGVIVWPACFKAGVGSWAQGEGFGLLAFRDEETASGWFHRAAFTSRSSRWKDNRSVLLRVTNA